jgi:hypothetical protein
LIASADHGDFMEFSRKLPVLFSGLRHFILKLRRKSPFYEGISQGEKFSPPETQTGFSYFYLTSISASYLSSPVGKTFAA